MEPVDVRAPGLPGRPILPQRWADVAFLHWRVDPDRVAPLLPPGVVPDVHEGASWVGLIAFRMVGAGLLARGPAVPWLGTFAETNVRLYSVDATGRRGVVFRSLETSRLAVVVAARLALGVPYTWARMRVRRAGGAAGGEGGGGTVEYTTRRRLPGPVGAGGRLVVRPGGPLPRPDPVADFLTARWGAHTRWAGRTLYVPNQHAAWPLHTAELLHLDDTLVAAAGLPGVTARPPDSVLFSPGVRTVFGLPCDARRPRPAAPGASRGEQ